jgi:predicted deacylase
MDRPLEVYRFGNGEPAYMIIAGIHGGYEWNTVELAYELIDLLIKEPERVHPK